MFMVPFCLNIFLSPLIVYFFFIIGITTFTEGSSARIADSCHYYLQVWTSWNTLNAFGNIGMMFCRGIYVRYATGLVTNGTKLFHILVCCVSGTFTLQWLGIQPLYYWLMVDNPMKTTLKGQICTRTQLTIFEDINKTINFSIKSKLLIITFSVLFLMVSLYFTKSSKRMNSKFKIPKRRINIVNMKMQNKYTAAIIINFIIDQVLMAVLEANYEDLGKQSTFVIFWVFHFWQILEIHVIANIFIIHQIHQIDEFNGYVGQHFPGQEQPQPLRLQPRREFFLKQQTQNSEQQRSTHTAGYPTAGKKKEFTNQVIFTAIVPCSTLTMVKVDIH